jgi:ubiquitin-protein ligase
MNLVRLRNDERELREYAASSGGRVTVERIDQTPWCAALKLRIPCPADSSFPARKINELTLIIRVQPDHPFSKPDFNLSPVPFITNVFASGRVCIGDNYDPSLAMIVVVERIEKMLTLDPAVTGLNSPANGDAANWYKEVTRTRKFAMPTMRLLKVTASKPAIKWL